MKIIIKIKISKKNNVELKKEKYNKKISLFLKKVLFFKK